MSAFDYKAQEEVLMVIRHLTHVLSVAGMHIVEILHQERRQKETVSASAVVLYFEHRVNTFDLNQGHGSRSI
jgi:cohesin loading factor subunit SCC2